MVCEVSGSVVSGSVVTSWCGDKRIMMRDGVAHRTVDTKSVNL